MEAAMPLYGHEMNDDVTPLETGLNFAVKMKKDDFIGKSAMEEAGAPKIKRVGLKVTGRGIIREDQTVYAEGAPLRMVAKKSVTPLPAPTAHSWANRWAWH